MESHKKVERSAMCELSYMKTIPKVNSTASIFTELFLKDFSPLLKINKQTTIA